ncbi:MAG: hypothetical protein CL916_00330 [Deltaproteobacteria bacterium]|nr:hypothetical protein [Deltaproteobacteria bacterium]
MRSTGIIALYCCFFASLASLIISVFGAIFIPDTGLGYFFGSIFLYFPLIPVHVVLVYFFRQIGYSKENIKWSMSALLWMTLLLTITQLSAQDYVPVIPFIIAIGVSQSFGYIQSFSLQPPKPCPEIKPAGMYSAI